MSRCLIAVEVKFYSQRYKYSDGTLVMLSYLYEVLAKEQSYGRFFGENSALKTAMSALFDEDSKADHSFQKLSTVGT